MALNKAMALNSGVVAAYHRVVGVKHTFSIDGSSGIEIQVDSYLNEDMRRNNKSIVTTSTVNLPPTYVQESDGSVTNIVAMAYNMLKRIESYSGSADC